MLASNHPMSLKSKFAHHTLNYYDTALNTLQNKPVQSLLSTILLLLSTSLGTTIVLNETKEMEEFHHPHEELIDQQYNALLNNLSKQHQDVLEFKSGAPFALYKYIEADGNDHTPDKRAYITQDLQRQSELKAQQRLYERSKSDFVVAVHVDERLDEKDAHDLIEAFQSTHGPITEISGFDYPLDYTNLFEAREIAKTEHLPVEERPKAKTINKTAEQLYDTKTGIKVGILSGILPLFLFILCGIIHSPMERWKNDKSSVRHRAKYKH